MAFIQKYVHVYAYQNKFKPSSDIILLRFFQVEVEVGETRMKDTETQTTSMNFPNQHVLHITAVLLTTRERTGTG